MSSAEYGEQIQVTGSILTLNIFEQKLMRNFFIINSKLKKLQQMSQYEVKIRALQKQQKFLTNKLEAMIERLPKQLPPTNSQIKQIAKQQVFEVLGGKDERLTTSRFAQDLNKQIHSLKIDIAKIRVNGSQIDAFDRKQSNAKVSFTAAQQLNQQSMQQNKKTISRESLNNLLSPNQVSLVDQIIKQDDQGNFGPVLQEINDKFADVYRKIQQLKLGKILAEAGEKDLQRFQKYEHYQQKSQQTARKIKQKNFEKNIKLQGIKNQNVKGQLLKNDLYAEYQKAQIIRQQLNKTSKIQNQFQSSKLIRTPQQTHTSGFKTNEPRAQLRSQIKMNDETIQIKQRNDRMQKMQRMKPSRSVKKLQRIQRRLKLDDIKDINSVLKEIQLRIQGRVTHEIFMGFVQDMQQKLQILRITKDPTNQLSQLRKMIYSLENRLQAVIVFLQNSANQDDALLVKKSWTCISCDKNIDKYNAKVGQHLAWDNLASKKISPTKAGAFGQTGQLANKIRSLMENQNQSLGE